MISTPSVNDEVSTSNQWPGMITLPTLCAFFETPKCALLKKVDLTFVEDVNVLDVEEYSSRSDIKLVVSTVSSQMG